MSGAEVVDGQRDSHPVEGLEGPHRAPWVHHRGALGDLELEGRRGELMALERGGDVVDEVRVEEVADREVHRDREVVAVAPPARALREGEVEHLVRERADQPGLLGRTDERVRSEEPVLRVLPAGERLDREHLAVPDAHLRLVVQHQLAVPERSWQLAREQRGVVLGGRGALVVLGDAIGARPGCRRGGVDAGQCDVRVDHPVRQEESADPRLDRDGHPGQLVRAVERPEDGRRNREDVGAAGDPAAQHGERVAAEARHHPAVPGDLDEAPADGPQDRVAGPVTEDVVDLGEALEVDQEQPGVVPPDLGERDPEVGDEPLAVHETGDEVRAGELVEPARVVLELTHHLDHPDGQERDHQDSGDDRRPEVQRPAGGELPPDERGPDHRDEPESDDITRAQARERGVGRAGEGAHRRVQGGCPPQHVGRQPQGVERVDLSGDGGDERRHVVQRVRGEQEDERDPQQHACWGSVDPTPGDPQQDREQQDVADRVGGCDDPRGDRPVAAGPRGCDDEHPPHEPDRHRDDRAVDQRGRGPPAVRARDQGEQRGGEDGVGGEIERVGERGERAHLEHVLVPRVDRVAPDPQRRSRRQQVPGDPGAGSVPAVPHEDRGDRRRADHGVGDVTDRARRDREDRDRGGEADTEVGPEGPDGRTRRGRRPGEVGGRRGSCSHGVSMVDTSA